MIARILETRPDLASNPALEARALRSPRRKLQGLTAFKAAGLPHIIACVSLLLSV